MDNGPISPDGRQQWNGEEWAPIPAPPKSRLTVHNYFQIGLIFLAAAVLVTVIMRGLGTT